MISDQKPAVTPSLSGGADGTHSPPPVPQPTAMPPPLPMAARPAKSLSLPKPYVVLWGAAAVVSMGYLTIAIAAPSLIGLDATADGDRPIVADSRQSPSAGSSTHARASDRELEENLTRARMEIAKLRTELTSREREEAKAATPFSIENVKTNAAEIPSPATAAQDAKAEEAQIAAGEDKIALEADKSAPLAPEAADSATPPTTIINQKPVVTSTLAANDPATPASTKVPTPAPSNVAAAAANAAEEKTIAKATLLNGTQEPASSPIETGSIRIPPPPVRGPERPRTVAQKPVQTAALQKPSVVTSPLPDVSQARRAAAQAGTAAAKPVAAFTAPVIERAAPPPAATTGLGLRLARGASLEAIRLTWSLMNERHGAVLSGLEPRYVLVPGPTPSQPLYQLIAGPLIGAGESLAEVSGRQRPWPSLRDR